MALIVTGVGSVIHVYSVGYMAHDKSFGRFFAYLNLFLFFMLLLVLGRSMLVMFVGWEGVGLASYLLIGFWFDDLANARAGKKAFVINRIGDAGFLLGMFLLYQAFGTLNMDSINSAFGIGAAKVVPASLVGILLFIGASGKSAQIPLHVWLPDAMAGPTPVSALIHAATMVTAGVYLVARMSGDVPARTGSLGADRASSAWPRRSSPPPSPSCRPTSRRCWPTPPCRSSGFMFLALGVGAYGVAIFHVVTHAFFKACLFLGAGSVIHALGGEQDMRKMGGLRQRIPVTFWTFAIATAAIAGIPPLAGFLSKDEILWFAFASTRGGSPLLWGVAALTALMTAFYMFRLLWLTFMGRSRMDARGRAPCARIAVVDDRRADAAGAAVGRGRLHRAAALPRAAAAAAGGARIAASPRNAAARAVGRARASPAWPAPPSSSAARTARAEGLQRRFAGLHRWLSGKYFIDELYERDRSAGRWYWVSDCRLPAPGRPCACSTARCTAWLRTGRHGAGLLGRVQTGSLHLYAWFVLVGIVGALLWSWRHV